MATELSVEDHRNMIGLFRGLSMMDGRACEHWTLRFSDALRSMLELVRQHQVPCVHMNIFVLSFIASTSKQSPAYMVDSVAFRSVDPNP
eukprot:gene15189-21264_t